MLAPDGLLVISTPNKHQYLVENEFHEREFTHEEFVALLDGLFPSVELALQHNWHDLGGPRSGGGRRGDRRRRRSARISTSSSASSRAESSTRSPSAAAGP